MTDCAKVRERLPDLLACRLRGGELDEVEWHLLGCQECERRLEEIQSLRESSQVYSPSEDRSLNELSATPPRPIPPPDVPGFEVGGELGRGGQCVVYRAR